MSDFDFLRPPPAFQEYASDLLSDRNYRSMSLAERGLFHLLRLELWVDRTLPADTEKLANLLRFSLVEIESAFTPRVEALFEISGGVITSLELERQRAKMARRRQRQSEGGAIGGLATQARLRDSQANLEGDPEGTPKVMNRKALSRKSKSGAEWDGVEHEGTKLSDDQYKWLGDYDKANENE